MVLFQIEYSATKRTGSLKQVVIALKNKEHLRFCNSYSRGMVVLDEKNMARNLYTLWSLLDTLFIAECFNLTDHIKHYCAPLMTLLLVKYFFFLQWSLTLKSQLSHSDSKHYLSLQVIP